ncbi:MAG: outer membrane protein assembly factor BamE [Gammaproteobacteria bacterium]|nr:outer membrane protein assembly factor BamE [Gammaproteobacteria bacterium]
MEIFSARSGLARLTLLCGCVMAAGCEYILPEGFELGQHRVAVQQGNTLTEESIRNLRTDMDIRQVLFLLGAPMVMDPFHPNRWDYPLYVEAVETGEKSRLDVVSLYFKDGRLKEVRRLVRIDPEVAKIEPGGELDAEAEWFEPGDALAVEETSGTEVPTPDAPTPEMIEDEAVAEPEQTPRN